MAAQGAATTHSVTFAITSSGGAPLGQVTANIGGTVQVLSQESQALTVADGAVLRLQAAPAGLAGWAFRSWRVEGGGATRKARFDAGDFVLSGVSADAVITATYVPVGTDTNGIATTAGGNVWAGMHRFT
jgi:hypothetical protein